MTLGPGLDLNLVAVFAKVVEAGSFTAAAAALNLPKSSVSRAVSRLEDLLGVRLLQRTTRKLGLTQAGDRYLAEVRGPIARLAEASSDVTELGHEPRGLVRLSIAHEVGEGRVTPFLAEFVRRYPKVQVDVVVTNRRVNLVAEGIDLAVRSGVLDDSSLVARKLAVSELGLYASPAYLGRRGRPRRIPDLGGHDCVLHRTQGVVQPWRLSGPRGIEQVSGTGPITVDDMGSVRNLALAGVGIALLPDIVIIDDLRAGRLERVLPTYAERGAATYVVSPPLRHVPARVTLLRDYLIAAIAEKVKGTPCALSPERPPSGRRRRRPGPPSQPSP